MSYTQAPKSRPDALAGHDTLRVSVWYKTPPSRCGGLPSSIVCTARGIESDGLLLIVHHTDGYKMSFEWQHVAEVTIQRINW